MSRIPEKYTRHLELLDVLTEIAEDLYYDCQINEYTIAQDPRDIAWEKKYAEITYRGKTTGDAQQKGRSIKWETES